MGLEKFPLLREIAWGKITTVDIQSDDKAQGMRFSIPGKKQMMTISATPEATSYTLSSEDGTPIVYVVQKGKELRVIDFSEKPKLAKMAKSVSISALGKIKKK